MEILFEDCGFTRVQRNAYLSEELGRRVKGLDELTYPEVSRFIEQMKGMKEEKIGREG